MREILFKAKRIDEQHKGEWIKGTPFFSPDKGRCVLIHAVAVHPDFVDDDGRVYYSEGTPVDPQPVCQCTGLTDSNGVKIFEGDFVNVRTTAYMFRSCVVKWNESNAMWSVASGAARYRMSDSFKYEVIGNIHDKEE